MTTTTQPTFDNIALATIRASSTNPRKHFCPIALDELAASIKELGVAQPILVRPKSESPCDIIQYEIVAGERRYRASMLAKQATIPAIIRNLNDLQALEIQVIENLQRADLHPLEEAEGYEQLMKQHGVKADELADKVGKSRSSVYGRLKLLELEPEARKAFYDGKLTPSTALLIARIPVKSLQAQAVEEITKSGRNNEPLSFRDAKEHIQDEYMLALKSAPFDTTNTNLLITAGSCAQCPKRTGNQPILFSDIESADVCTDPECFGMKRQAHKEMKRADAIASGRKIISGDEARKLKPHHWSQLGDGYVNLNDKCFDDAKARTYREIIGKAMPATTLFENPHDEDGDLIEIIKRTDIAALLKKNIIKPKERSVKATSSTSSWQKEQAAREEKARPEREYRRALFDKTRVKAGERPLGLTNELLQGVAILLAKSSEQGDLVAELHGLDAALFDYNKVHDELPEVIRGMTPKAVLQLIADLVLSEDLIVNEYNLEDTPPPSTLLAVAASVGVAVAVVKQEQNKAEAAAKKKPASKKAAAEKPTQTAEINTPVPVIKTGVPRVAAWPFPKVSRTGS